MRKEVLHKRRGIRKKDIPDMSDRQEIIINRELSTEELYQIMLDHWDTRLYGEFIIDYKNMLSEEPGIFLPATKRFMVLVESLTEGIFRKESKVVLSVIDTPKGMEETLRRSFPTGVPFLGAIKIGRLASIKKERKKTENTLLVSYTDYMRKILNECGFLVFRGKN